MEQTEFRSRLNFVISSSDSISRWTLPACVPSKIKIAAHHLTIRRTSSRRIISTLLTSTTLGSLHQLLFASNGWTAEYSKPPIKLYTNIEDAREAGERKRQEKEQSQGPIISLTSGVKFREIAVGNGQDLQRGDTVYICYTLYRVNGFYLDSVGYGREGKDDVGDTFIFVYGETKIPSGVEMAMEGMKVGGKRRVLVPANLGWVTADILPSPTSTAAVRRINNSLSKNLLFEVEIVKIRR